MDRPQVSGEQGELGEVGKVGERIAFRITVKGRVQGVGFRPFLFRLAEAYRITGWVQNNMDGIRMEAEGTPEDLKRFIEGIQKEAPRLSRVEFIEATALTPNHRASFEIIPSIREGASSLVIPVDSAVCEECLEEMRDPADPRYRYPFINCTQCGPRYTIIGELPYDRAYTSMEAFPMCDRCKSEYEDIRNRRHHAQPIACPECGPKVTLLDMDGGRLAEREQAIQACIGWLKQGAIVAVKGLGGYHLACDASNEAAVQRLRERKRRPRRPLAVMARSIGDCGRIAIVSDGEKGLLESPEAPIVILQKRRAASVLAESVAPGMASVGIMLPYTPLHHLLLEELPLLVMTSANPSGLPILYKDEEALPYLNGIADYVLMHNRNILHPLDDSVVQLNGGELDILRRSRGFVPDPLEAGEGENVHGFTALGGQQKNTFALGRFGQIFLGPHIGEMDHVEVEEHWGREYRHLSRWMGIPAGQTAVDQHPGYTSGRLAQAWGLRTVKVQHHHAHLVSCAADNGLSMREKVLGLILDGTGYGADGCIWGFEVLYGDAAGYERMGHLRYTPLPGGEAAIRHPWRNAAGMLMQLEPEQGLEWAERLFPGKSKELSIISRMIETGTNSPLAGTCGRLFDAASAVLGLVGESTYDGEAAIKLSEWAAFACEGEDEFFTANPYPYDLRELEGLWELDMRQTLRALTEDRLAGRPVEELALRFHETVAQGASSLLLAAHRGLEAEDRCRKVVLSGGSFHNRYLRKRIKQLLQREGLEVFTHKKVPSGDGGLAIGQLLAAVHHTTNPSEEGH